MTIYLKNLLEQLLEQHRAKIAPIGMRKSELQLDHARLESMQDQQTIIDKIAEVRSTTSAQIQQFQIQIATLQSTLDTQLQEYQRQLEDLNKATETIDSKKAAITTSALPTVQAAPATTTTTTTVMATSKEDFIVFTNNLLSLLAKDSIPDHLAKGQVAELFSQTFQLSCSVTQPAAAAPAQAPALASSPPPSASPADAPQAALAAAAATPAEPSPALFSQFNIGPRQRSRSPAKDKSNVD